MMPHGGNCSKKRVYGLTACPFYGWGHRKQGVRNVAYLLSILYLLVSYFGQAGRHLVG